MPHPTRVAVAALFACLAAGPTTAPTSQPTTGPAAIDWSDAAKHVGQTVTVTGPVKGTHKTAKNLILNVGKDYPAKDRFSIMMPLDAGGSPDDRFVGKTVTITGTVKLYRDVPEIVATSAADVTIGK